MTRICHLSDTHSSFPRIDPNCDVIVHTGDFFGNYNPMDRVLEEHLQLNWLRQNLETIRVWLNDKPLIFVGGNHDFASPILTLLAAGFEAYEATNNVVNWGGLSFYGLPYVPAMSGSWNWELCPVSMQYAVDDMRDILYKNEVDILLAHAPPYGILDKNGHGNHCGSQALKNMLEHNSIPSLSHVLFGHLHEQGGTVHMYNNMLLSNAATTCNYIEL